MTQQACIVSNLSLAFPTQSMFEQLNFVLHAGKTSALIGRNGLGKSLLFKILNSPSQAEIPYSGQVSWNMPHEYLAQIQRLNAENISQALEVDVLYDAFQRIENNTANFSDFDLVENHWDAPQQWQQLLSNANLPTDLKFPIQQLSEGQKTKLALCRLFLKQDHYLLLDEPSNHLDTESRQWLIQSIHAHKAGVCVISHDQRLLNEVEYIYALSELGLQQITGNYEEYAVQHQQQLNALSKSVEQEKRDIQQQKQQQHESLMKAQKRQRKGNQLRDSNSQAKILLDFNKEQASQSLGKLKNQQMRQHEDSQAQLSEKKSRLEKIKPQKFDFQFKTTKHGEILRINDLKLPYASQQKIKLSLQAGEKIHLKGANGIGKSTLLKHIVQHVNNFEVPPEIYFTGNVLYLDQNFSLLNDELSVLENLARFNSTLLEVEWRNLLGQLRIRREKSLLKLAQLSGGEKLKVALLAISHSQENIDLLLLDEPENHLDLESKQLLAQAIQQFQGAIILVSHDDYFVEQCGISSEYKML